MKTKNLAKLLIVLLVAGLLGTSCKSGVNMYRHEKSCDCPRFD